MVADSVSREISTLVKKIDFSTEIIGKKEIESLFEENVIYICEECQCLYERRPHGFDILRMFLSNLVTNSRQIITTWNQYSWNFLSGFLNIERWFPIVVSLPLLSLPQMQQYLLSGGNDTLRFIIDTDLDNSLELVRKDFEITFAPLNFSFSLPYLTVRRRYASYIPFFAEKKALPEELIFRELYRLSSGEPGIASKLFHDVIMDDEIRFQKLPKSPPIPNLYAIDNYILTLILMYESPVYSRLNQSVQDKALLNSSLYRLLSAGLIIRDGEKWSISAQGFAPAVSYLTQRRMIW